MSEWKSFQLEKLIVLHDSRRIPLSSLEREKRRGSYPYYGAASIVDYVDDYLYDGDYILFGEDGTVITDAGKPILQMAHGKFWVNNHAHVITVTDLADFRFIYYTLKNTDVRAIVTGAVQPKISQANLKTLRINIPPLPTQRKIAAVLGALDDKIENNRKICANLEAQAQAIFKSWFVDFEPFGGKMPQGWKMGKLGDVAIYRQGKIAANELTAETYYSTENMLPDKQGLMPATSLPQIGEVPACEKGDVLISNIRPYFKKICFSWSHGGHSPDVLCLAAKNDNMRYWLYRQLWDDTFFSYVMSSAKGTKMPRGDKEQILAYALAIPKESDVARFNAVIEPMCESIVSKGFESRALAAMRDALLPKLMSGEIDVEKVEVA